MSNQNLNIIKHSGKVIFIKDNDVKVKILSTSACSSCHAKGVCSASDIEEKVVEVKISSSLNTLTVGDEVMVSLSQNLGFYALFLGYLLPLILVVLMIILLTLLKQNELLTGLTSLLLLFPYYVIIYTNREKLKNKFSFKIDLL